MICQCGLEAEFTGETTLRVPVAHAGKKVRAWRCQCGAVFHTIEGRIDGPRDLGITVVDEHEAAEILGKSVYTLRNERSQQRSPVPFVRQGRRVGYLLCDLSDYLLSRRVMPGGVDEVS
ncbi:MAG: hypothetical protein ABIL58_23395 [Pseudomonadota bacterium]